MLHLFLFMVWFDDGKSVLDVKVEDISAAFVISVAFHEEEAIFLTCKPVKEIPVPQLEVWHVNAKTMKLSKLNDARFSNMFTQIQWIGGSFSLLGPLADKVVKLNKALLFSEQLSVKDFFGATEPLPGTISYCSPYLKGQNLVTFKLQDQFVLGVFDGHLLDLVASYQPDPGVDAFWLYVDKHVLLVEPELGKISLTDSKFLPQQVLVKGHAPIKRNGDARLSKLLVSRGLSPYYKTFTSIIPAEAYFTCNVLDYMDDEGNIRKRPLKGIRMFNSKGLMKSDPKKQIIISNQTKRLIFNDQEGIFEIEKL